MAASKPVHGRRIAVYVALIPLCALLALPGAIGMVQAIRILLGCDHAAGYSTGVRELEAWISLLFTTPLAVIPTCTMIIFVILAIAEASRGNHRHRHPRDDSNRWCSRWAKRSRSVSSACCRSAGYREVTTVLMCVRGCRNSSSMACSH